MNTLRGRIALFICLSVLAAGCGSSGGGAQSTEIIPTAPVTDAAADDGAYALDWKLAEGEVLAYETAMQVSELDVETDFSLDDLDNLGDLEGMEDADFADFFGALIAGFADYMPEMPSYISLLELNDRGNVTIRMILDEVVAPEFEPDDEFGAGFADLFGMMAGTVQLRGELSPDGAITSFYYGGQQRNIVAILFELPTGPVRVGDTWSLDFQCMTFDHSLIADDAWRVNEVTFSEVARTDDGRPVAVLDYVLIESVTGHYAAGSLQMDFFGLDDEETSGMCSFVGQGRFLIEEGRWESFAGQFRVQQTGFLASDVSQMLALTPTEDYPAEYDDLE